MNGSEIELMGKDIRDIGQRIKGMKERMDAIEREIPRIGADLDQMAGHVGGIRRQALPGGRARAGATVSDECARTIGTLVLLGAEKFGRLRHLRESVRSRLLGDARMFLGQEQVRAAISASDIPLPVAYSAELVSLVNEYSKARKYGTIYPAGLGGTTKLPRLKASPGFGFVDMSAAIPEKKPALEWVDFDPEKAGGIVRVPSEIDMDSVVKMGQFVAAYCAREMARFEDQVFFNADGTATYKSFKGALKSAADLGRKVTLSAGKMSPDDITLADIRAMRAHVDTAALMNGAYYFNPTIEAKLASFNSGFYTHPVYIRNGPNGPTLDSFPIRWVEQLPVFETADQASQLQCAFGDMSYFYLAVRPGVNLMFSKDAYWATDELAFRMLERFAPGLMADGAISTLELAAS